MQKKNQQSYFSDIPRQLALPFTYTPRFLHSEFIAAPSNAAARAWLGINHQIRLQPDWPDQRLALWGDSGTGKTHLLQVWAEKESGLFVPGSVLAQSEPLFWPQKIREDHIKALVVDDADMITNPRALLHLLNVAKEFSLPVVLSGRVSPARWVFDLPDLTSRLRAITTVKIEQPEEDLLRILMLRLLAEHQLIVPSQTVEWLILHLPRTAWAVREAVQRLDKITLAEGKGINKSLIIRVLDNLLSSDVVDVMDSSQELLLFSNP